MKRVLFFIILLLLLSLFAACRPSVQQDEISPKISVTETESPPSTDDGIILPSNNLIPRDDYGPLLPYGALPQGISIYDSRKNGNFGFVTLDGEIVTEPCYYDISRLSLDAGDFYLLQRISDYELESGERSGTDKALCAVDGSFVTPFSKDIMNTVSKDLTPVNYESLMPFHDGDFWGYMDEDGNVAIKPEYSFVKGFNDGRAIVGGGEEFVSYVIDKTGKKLFSIKGELSEYRFDDGAVFYYQEGVFRSDPYTWFDYDFNEYPAGSYVMYDGSYCIRGDNGVTLFRGENEVFIEGAINLETFETNYSSLLLCDYVIDGLNAQGICTADGEVLFPPELNCYYIIAASKPEPPYYVIRFKYENKYNINPVSTVFDINGNELFSVDGMIEYNRWFNLFAVQTSYEFEYRDAEGNIVFRHEFE